jgi:GTP-binding protein HflX
LPQIKIPAYHFPDRSGPKELGTPFKGIVVVQLVPPGTPEEDVEEAYGETCCLVETLGGKVVGQVVQRRPYPHPEYYIGPGKADEVGALCDHTEADTVVVDAELNPNQVAFLEYETGSHVMDRTELILEIFSRRARTAEAKIQVELAYLDYLHPKMDKESSIRAYRGGLRGHGESALAKRIRAGRTRAQALRKKLKKLAKHRETQISRRKDLWTVALVGYTNAGKSTLLNAMTGENLYADDRLFATLDTTTRRVFLKDGHFALMSDTVGFIRRLPHQLVASFHSTLAEALSADLLLHVADASSPTVRHQIETVEQTLTELEAGRKPGLLAFSKMDVATKTSMRNLKARYPGALFLSGKRKQGLDRLRLAILEHFSPPQELSDESGGLSQAGLEER